MSGLCSSRSHPRTQWPIRNPYGTTQSLPAGCRFWYLSQQESITRSFSNKRLSDLQRMCKWTQKKMVLVDYMGNLVQKCYVRRDLKDLQVFEHVSASHWTSEKCVTHCLQTTSLHMSHSPHLQNSGHRGVVKEDGGGFYISELDFLYYMNLA